MKKTIFHLLTIGIIFLASLASAGSLKLTTYIPSPVGAFDRLRLVPRTALGLPCEAGTFYIEAPNLARFCQENGLGNAAWTSFPGVWTQATSAVYPTDTDQVDPTADTVYLGIGTTTPQFKLTLEQDGGILAKGTFGSGATLTTAGAGTRFIWYPRKAALRAGHVTGTAWDDANIGNYSTAMGLDTTASDAHAMAFGDRTTANDLTAVAFGSQTVASGVSSMASGDRSEANGNYSVASGVLSIADGIGSVAIGNTAHANSDYSFAFGNQTVANNTAAFASGNLSQANGVASFATGENTRANGNYSFAAGYNSQALNDYAIATGDRTTANGSGSVAMGSQTAANMNNAVAFGTANTTAGGLYSTAIGSGLTASGPYSLAMGQNNQAIGQYSVALGGTTVSLGDYAVAMGSGTHANGTGSVAMGLTNTASGNFAVATGNNTTAAGDASFVSGLNSQTTATGDYAFASGTNCSSGGQSAVATGSGPGSFTSVTGNYAVSSGSTLTGATGNYSVLLGGSNNASRAEGAVTIGGQYNLASGRYSVAFGTGMQVYNDFSVGFSLNDPGVPVTVYQVNQPNTLCIVGGAGLRVLIGRLTSTAPGYTLEVSGNAAKTSGGQWSTPSDARLKKNIKPITPNFALKKFLKLHPVSFEWKDPKEHGDQTETQIGFIAQDVEKVIPQWVGGTRKGPKTLNVSGIDALTVESLRALRQQLNDVKITYAKIVQKNSERLQQQAKTIETLKQKLEETHEKNK